MRGQSGVNEMNTLPIYYNIRHENCHTLGWSADTSYLRRGNFVLLLVWCFPDEAGDIIPFVSIWQSIGRVVRWGGGQGCPFWWYHVRPQRVRREKTNILYIDNTTYWALKIPVSPGHNIHFWYGHNIRPWWLLWEHEGTGAGPVWWMGDWSLLVACLHLVIRH